MSVLYWLTSVAALLAVLLNIRRQVACFWIWAFTNVVWVYADIDHGVYPQAALQMVYFGLSIYGLVKWRREGKQGG